MGINHGILVKYGEIALRGKNRPLYENMLIKAIERNLAQFGDFWVKKEQGRFFVSTINGDFDAQIVSSAIADVFGVCAVCPCFFTDDMSLENIKRLSLAHILEETGGKPFTFKFETRRADKRYPLKSYEISAALGEFVLENAQNARVDVHNPDITVNVEIRGKAYIFSRETAGNGGLPPSSAGAGVLLLSGGFDSPVAGFLAAKRGVEIIAAYFHSPPFTSERAKEKVKDLAERLSRFTGRFTLCCVPFADIQLFLRDNIQAEKLTILLKRAMLKTAERIAESRNALVLITGDSIGQVASQTLRSINAVDSAARLPVIRPLACFDKREIIDLAKKIGTYDISARPYDDCCTLFVADHPETKPKRSIIERIEAKITDDLDALIAAAIEKTEIFEF